MKKVNLSIIILSVLMASILAATAFKTSLTSVWAKSDRLFLDDEVIDVYIDIEEGGFEEILAQPMAEKYYKCDIIYNGIEVENAAIRTKGNSSLSSTANSDSKRYSFKIDIDYYVGEQSLLGIKKLCLNNSFSDPTYMREVLGYELMDDMGLFAPRFAYVNLYINGELHGLYLCVEAIDETFLKLNYDNGTGNLYKPERMDLSWLGEDESLYTSLNLKTNESNPDYSNAVNMINVLNNGGDIEEVLNVDNVLRYIAVSTVAAHFDNYTGSTAHNYYLYDNEGVFDILPWDMNMAFGGFPMAGTNQSSVLIDEPVSGLMEQRPLVSKLFKIPGYLERYHGYLEELIYDYMSYDKMKERIEEIMGLISPYVKADPTKFYTYEQFKSSIYEDIEGGASFMKGNTPGLLPFIEDMIGNIEKQLSGEIPSKGDGSGSGMGIAGKDFINDRERILNGENLKQFKQNGNFPEGQENLSERVNMPEKWQQQFQQNQNLPEGQKNLQGENNVPENREQDREGNIIPEGQQDMRNGKQQFAENGMEAEGAENAIRADRQAGMGKMSGNADISNTAQTPMSKEALISVGIILALMAGWIIYEKLSF